MLLAMLDAAKRKEFDVLVVQKSAPLPAGKWKSL